MATPNLTENVFNQSFFISKSYITTRDYCPPYPTLRFLESTVTRYSILSIFKARSHYNCSKFLKLYRYLPYEKSLLVVSV